MYSKEKMKTSGFSIYLDATLERNINRLLTQTTNPSHYNNEVDDNNRAAISNFEASRLSSGGFDKKEPQTEDEFKKTLEEINIKTDEYLNNIQKIKEQIQNFQANNNDYNKKKNALNDSKTEKSSNKLSLLTFIFLLTMGLLIGAFINNKILN